MTWEVGRPGVGATERGTQVTGSMCLCTCVCDRVGNGSWHIVTVTCCKTTLLTACFHEDTSRAEG